MRELFDILGGRKNTLAIFVLAALTLLYSLGSMPIEAYVEQLKWILGIGVGGHALVDASIALKGGGRVRAKK